MVISPHPGNHAHQECGHAELNANAARGFLFGTVLPRISDDELLFKCGGVKYPRVLLIHGGVKV